MCRAALHARPQTITRGRGARSSARLSTTVPLQWTAKSSPKVPEVKNAEGADFGLGCSASGRARRLLESPATY